MAKAIIKVDVRSPSLLQSVLESQQSLLASYGGLTYSLCLNNNKRNIGYIILEWTSLRSLNDFLESTNANMIFKEWPVVEVIEILELFDLKENMTK